VTVRRFRVTGRVQGVGFRAFVVRHARGAGMRAGVRNERDGSVVCVAAGGAAGLEGLRRALARGPAMARVEAVEEAELAAWPDDERFDALVGDLERRGD
jgi:acylphosphatase